jgi:hypothetical protein
VNKQRARILKKKTLRPMGQITADMELLLQEMTDEDQHDMQWHEVHAVVRAWLEVHSPDQQEEYTDGKRPVFSYRRED